MKKKRVKKVEWNINEGYTSKSRPALFDNPSKIEEKEGETDRSETMKIKREDKKHPKSASTDLYPRSSWLIILLDVAS